MRVASVSVLLVLLVASPALAQTQLTVTAVNKLKTARPSDTIELTADALAALGEKDLMNGRVFCWSHTRVRRQRYLVQRATLHSHKLRRLACAD